MTKPLVVDDQAVWRFLHGDRTVRLHSKERIVAIRQLLAAGVLPAHIAKRIGCTLQYVCQIRDGKRGWKVPTDAPTPVVADDPELPEGHWVSTAGGVKKWIAA